MSDGARASLHVLQPLLIGITGGMGAGKSLVSRLFGLLDIPCFEADTRARQFLDTSALLREKIKAHFGPKAYKADGKANTAWLAGRIFASSQDRQWIEKKVHPLVQSAFLEWIAAQSQQVLPPPYVLYEAAILLEKGAHQALDYTLLVLSPMELRLKHLRARDPQRSPQQIQQMIEAQWPDAKKKDLVPVWLRIQNDERQALLPQVLHIDRRLRQIATAQRA